MSSEMVLQTTLNGVVLGLLYILLGVGMALLYAVMGVLYFASGQTYMLASFAMYYIVVRLGLNYIPALILTVVLMAVFGLMIEKGLFRRVRGQPGNSFIIAMGLAWILENSGYLVFGILPKKVPTFFKGELDIFGAVVSWERLVVVLGGILAVVAVHLFLTRTKPGVALRAFVDDPDAAALQGISSDFVSALGFVIACALCGVAAALVAPVFAVEVGMGLTLSLKGFMIIGLGGLGSIFGVFIAAIMVGFIDSFGSTLIGPVFTYMVVFIFLVVFLSIRPRGLMGIERALKV